jgi:DNA (cytosine-5)-methyltransferase 1
MSPSRNGNADKPGFYEFFAGAGLVRLGLEPEWRCLWANDIDPRKAEAYVANFGPGEFRLGDIAEVRGPDLPGRAELAWASFPCQDLSLAGPRLGMRGSRSATFWEFVRVLRELAAEGRRPPLAVVENVAGLLKRESLEPVCEALVRLGLRPGALLIDARWFLPQSRPRVFVVAAEEGLLEAAAAQGLIADGPDPASPWTPARLRRAFQALPKELQEAWVWWRLPPPPERRPSLASLLELEEAPEDAPWHPPEETRRLLAMMAPSHRWRVREAQRSGRRTVGALYRRMRDGEQRAEIRVDGLAGCLRASRGGSSRLILMVIEGEAVRSRRLSAREAARLMGVPDGFRLPGRYGDAYNAVADGVAVPVVRWLSRHLLLPLARAAAERSIAMEAA